MIVDAQLYHCGRMARQLRSQHLEAVKNVGADIHRELRNRFYESSYRKALILDGRLIALGGVTGSLASPYGYVWLAVSNEAQQRPQAVLKAVIQCLREIMGTHTEVATTIISNDDAGRRLAAFLGFHVSHQGPGAPAFSKSERAVLNEHLLTEETLRKPVGNGFAIALGLHRD